MADYYVDDNETVYATEDTLQFTGAGSSDQQSLGLSDLLELPGQSTWFINKVVFAYTGVCTGAVAGNGYVVAGVVRRDLVAGTNFQSFGDFQDVKGFPLKGSKKFFYYTPDPLSTANEIKLVHTWTPRKALLLNREQDIVFNIRNRAGSDLEGILSINIQAKRGD